MKPLTPHQLDQLRILAERGATSRETAISVCGRPEPNPGTLSRLWPDLTAYAKLPIGGDRRRRLAHYWLTPAGRVRAEASQ